MEIEKYIILKDLSILSINGKDRFSMNGKFYLNVFVDKLIYEWIPYLECHKCGRNDYCKFTEPHHININKKKEIKCGVVKTALTNFMNYTLTLFNSLDAEKQQKYIDGLFYFQKYIYTSEQTIGMFLNKNILNWYDEYAPMAFGQLSLLRSNLNYFANNLKDISEFRSKKGILLLEGWSEKEFVDTMCTGGSIFSHRFEIEVYDGKNNKSPKKLKLLTEKLKKDGYTIFIEGDKDGKNVDIFQKHKQSNLIDKENEIQFLFDFETSFPPELMFQVLKNLNLIQEKVFDNFKKDIYPCDSSVIKKLELVYKIEFSKYKMAIANMAGKILKNTIWWSQNEIMESELGDFLTFVRKI